MRSALVKQVASFFFQPRQLRGQAADLGIEFVNLLLVGSGFGRLIAFGLVREYAGQRRHRLVAPFGQQIAMDAMFGRNLVERLFFSEPRGRAAL
jgi:hypothetical protein